MRTYDIVVVTDTRLVGGGNKSLAQEVRAHAARGYTTGILPFASNTKGPRPVDASIRELLDDGLATWVRPDDGVHCRLAMARGPFLFLEPQTGPVRLNAERAVLVANAVHPDPSISSMAYAPDAVDAALEEVFGYRWEWVPLSEVVRKELAGMTSRLKVSEVTWGNILSLDHWRLHREDRLRRPFRVGRHSRDAPAKWPTSAREILAAYPADAGYDVRVMGGARRAEALLGEIPSNWTVEPFGARHPRSFLTEVDVYPYFHHPKWIEAFGRAPLEAIATGAVAILPPYLEAVFGPGALYGRPADVRTLVERLGDDPAYLAERREAGWQTVRDRFSPEAYLARLETLIGPPGQEAQLDAPPRSSERRAESTIGPPRRSRSGARDGRPRVVFFTDNGHGLGHVSRMLAIATRSRDLVDPFLLTMSEAFQVAADAGVPAEYFPSAKRLGIDRKAWREMLRLRLYQTLQRLRPQVLVVDHVNPPPQILEVAADLGTAATVWVRRGLWRAGRRPEGARYSNHFDHILEPLDLAAALDRGATTRMAHPRIHYVNPVNLVDSDEMVSRDDARRALGLDLDGSAVLINMSADSSEELARLVTHVRDAVRRRRPEASLFAPLHILHRDRLPAIDGVTMRPIYPVARYLHAFDAVVSTTGYNSFHEIVLAGTPAIFVARDTGTLDDQALRARAASLGGFGVHVEDVWSGEFERALDQVLNPVLARRMRSAAVVAHPGNGAGDAAELIAKIAYARMGTR